MNTWFGRYAAIAIFGATGIFLYQTICWSRLDASVWASWVQAVGSIVAILGSFLILHIQHRTERTNDRTRRDEQEKDVKDSALRSRTNAVKNVVQVTSYSLQIAGTLVQVLRDEEQSWKTEKHMSQIFQLRAVLDSMINSDADHLAVIAALDASMVLTEVHNDLRHIGGAMTEQILDRCQGRINTGFEFLGRLIDLQNNLINICRERNIPLEISDFRN